MSYEIHLEVFEGPFQLLLALISERQVDVCDVPISQLCEDYLSHLAKMEQLDLEVTTEFLVVAATLLQLKVRALLPEPAVDDEFDTADADRDLLIARLLEVRTFQAAGAHLGGLLAAGDRRFPPFAAPDDEGLRQLPTLAGLVPADLARTLIEVVKEGSVQIDTALLVGDEISPQHATAELLSHLAAGPSTFDAVARGRSLSWAVALFLAMLELALRGEIRLGQADRLGEIRMEPAAGGVGDER